MFLHPAMDTHDGRRNSPSRIKSLYRMQLQIQLCRQEGSSTLGLSILSAARQFGDWHGWLVGVSLLHRLRCNG
ncbi:expressed protein [Echinococcus multilocularis]|uniref:Expressed protein n=1 Tax=Echinococcus multilocularis TaxID=6211 RepID=A0A068Y5L6_ECHMU|nr:expressed protein [Echinococcus multilocularis]